MTITHEEPAAIYVQADRCSSEPVGAGTNPFGGNGKSGRLFQADEQSEQPNGNEPLWQKPVKKTASKRPSTVEQAVHAKEFSMHKRSILTNSTPHNPTYKMRAKVLLDQPLPTEQSLKPWRDTDEFTKLAAAATPLYWMAKKKGWELKAFTLVLEKNLSARMDAGDVTAFDYIRDQLTRQIKKALGAGAEFLYGIEKAPMSLSDESSRRRWHLHGLIIGPTGFAATGKTPLRKALKAIKGEADSDLMFEIPGMKLGRDLRASAMGWCFYAVKNGLSANIDSALIGAYQLPPGKHTYTSALLKREAKRWYSAKRAGRTDLVIIQKASRGAY